MASLGSFGTKRESEVVDDITFEYFGITIHLSPLSFNELEFVDLMEKANQVDESNPQAVTLIKDMFRLVLAEESLGYPGAGFDTFWATAKQHRQGIEDLMPVYTALMEANSARPTRKPSDSSDGLTNITENSPVASSSPPVSSGRPDIQVMRDQSNADRQRILSAVAG